MIFLRRVWIKGTAVRESGVAVAWFVGRGFYGGGDWLEVRGV